MRKIYYNRKSIRLKNYDYSQNGMYFITICTKNREPILSEIIANNCRGRVPPLPNISNKIIYTHNQNLNQFHNNLSNFQIIQTHSQIGKNIDNTIKNMNKSNYINISPYVIMPDHIHFIIETNNVLENNYNCDGNLNEGRGGTLPLQAIIGRFKSYTTKQYNVLNETIGKKLWQRGFYEHIIRYENEYYKICEYIKNNPKKYLEEL